MMYTRERLIKAVREAGRDGRQFTLGEVRAELGIKNRDKRELKRFRSRFRECGTILGDNLEKLGPNTFRLKTAYLAAHPADRTVQVAVALKGVSQAQHSPARSSKQPAARDAQKAEAEEVPLRLLDRVVVPTTEHDDEWKRRPREQVSFDKAPLGDAAASAPQRSFGERISTWFGRPTRPQTNNAAVALSRLAVELQPKAAAFEYRWKDGKLEVQRANK